MEQITAVIRLKSKRAKPILNRHPWLFSGAIAGVEGEPRGGDIVQIVDHAGVYRATAYYNPSSQIRCRILSWDENEQIDNAFWQRRLETAITFRRSYIFQPNTTAYRLVNAESDFLPGLIVDQYGDYLVLQCLTLGIDRRKRQIAAILNDLCRPKGIVERSDAYARKREGLSKVAGQISGEAPPDQLTIIENGIRFEVNLLEGQKTGFYLDQRDNRTAVTQPNFVKNKTVLNVFSYTGGFGLYAVQNGAASVIHIDSSIDALQQAENNVALNGWTRPNDEFIAGDTFEILRHYRDQNRRFDLIILDPPKFAKSQKDVEAACRGYKDLNWLAMRLLNPQGVLATFSCSGLVSAELFRKVVFGAALDAGRDAQIIRHLYQSPDHPVALTVPQSAYLKGLLLAVL